MLSIVLLLHLRTALRLPSWAWLVASCQRTSAVYFAKASRLSFFPRCIVGALCRLHLAHYTRNRL